MPLVNIPKIWDLEILNTSDFMPKFYQEKCDHSFKHDCKLCEGQNYCDWEISGHSYLFAVEVLCNTKQFPIYMYTVLYNNVMMTSKCCLQFLLLIFILKCLSKFNLIRIIPNHVFLVCFVPNRLEFHFNWIEIEPIIWPYRVSMSQDSRNVGLEASDWLITNLGSYITDT